MSLRQAPDGNLRHGGFIPRPRSLPLGLPTPPRPPLLRHSHARPDPLFCPYFFGLPCPALSCPRSCPPSRDEGDAFLPHLQLRDANNRAAGVEVRQVPLQRARTGGHARPAAIYLEGGGGQSMARAVRLFCRVWDMVCTTSHGLLS